MRLALNQEPQANLNKPDKSGSSRFFIGTIAVSRTEEAMEYGTNHFQKQIMDQLTPSLAGTPLKEGNETIALTSSKSI